MCTKHTLVGVVCKCVHHLRPCMALADTINANTQHMFFYLLCHARVYSPQTNMTHHASALQLADTVAPINANTQHYNTWIVPP